MEKTVSTRVKPRESHPALQIAIRECPSMFALRDIECNLRLPRARPPHQINGEISLVQYFVSRLIVEFLPSLALACFHTRAAEPETKQSDSISEDGKEGFETPILSCKHPRSTPPSKRYETA
jgi:hypothetical protein